MSSINPWRWDSIFGAYFRLRTNGTQTVTASGSADTTSDSLDQTTPRVAANQATSQGTSQPQSPSHSAAAGSRSSLRPPPLSAQGREAASTLSSPSCLLPLTRAALEAWAKDPQVSEEERGERHQVQRVILAASDQNLEIISIPHHLVLRNLQHVRCLPDGLSVGGNFTLLRVRSLMYLPEGLSVGGSLKLWNVSSLMRLPATLSVGRDLSLDSADSLMCLPEELNVGQDLFIENCRNLTLSESFRVGRDVYLINCPEITNLPQNMLQWPRCSNGERHTIFIDDVGISDEVRRELENWVRERASACGVELNFVDPIRPVAQRTRLEELNNFTTLPEAWRFWRGSCAHNTAGRAESTTEPEFPGSALPTAAQETLKNFLEGLRSTHDYKNAQTRPLLRERVFALSEALQHVDADTLGLVIDILHNAVTSCGDRLVLGFDDVELALRLQTAARSDDPSTLRDLGIAYLKLEMVRNGAAQKIASLVAAGNNVDEIEVYLAYATRLAERLGLPINTRGMLYHAPVTTDDLEQASSAAQAAANDPDQVAKFLQSWGPWQNYERRHQAQAVRWEELPAVPITQDHQDGCCVITQEPLANLAQPVTLDGDKAFVAEFSAFMTWYQQHGTHPVKFTNLSTDRLRRLIRAAD